MKASYSSSGMERIIPHKPLSLLFSGALVALLASGLSLSAQELIWSESFETDGEGSRYVTEGAGVFEVSEFADFGISTDQAGPVYWTRVTDGRPSFVGVPAPTPERRIVMAWGSGIVPDDITDEFWTHFEGVVAWLLRGKSNATILFSGLSGDGDMALASRLESLGHTIEEDDTGSPPPDSGIDMYVYSGGSTSRFVNYQVPGLHYNSNDLDDELLSSIGTPLTTTLPDVRITAPEHGAAGGQEGEFTFVNNQHTFQGLGSELPGGSTIVAGFVRLVSASVLDLDAADALFDGTTPNTGVSRTTVTVADLVNELSPASQLEFFDWDNPIAGDPDGGFAVRVTGKLQADEGRISLAIGGTDGSRLRIDLDQNGLTADDRILSQDRRGGWQYTRARDVTFPSAGTYDFEWVSFNAAAEYGAEFLVGLEAGGRSGPVTEEAYDLVSGSSAHVKIDGDLTVETYVPDLPPEEVLTPFTMALEAPDDGGAVFGGGPFGSFDGDHFFAGSALNKFTGDDGVGNPKWITWNDPIDVSGKENVKLTLGLGATFLDFETGDYFKVYIDDGDEPLIWFTAPSGDDKFFNDVTTNPSNPTRLGLALQDITYDIPDDVNSINLRIESVTTWWNEIVAFDNIRVTSGELAPAAPPLADGAAISINFGSEEPNGGGSTVSGAAGVLGTVSWNNLTGSEGTDEAVSADVSGSSTATGVTVSWTSNNTWASGGRSENNNSAPDGDNRNLMIGYLDTNATDPATVTVNGLPADKSYDVVVYTKGGVVGRGGDYTIGDNTQSHVDTAAFDGNFALGGEGDYLVFRGVTGESFQLVAQPTTGSPARAPVNGIEILVGGGVPEPPGPGAAPTISISRNADGTLTVVFEGVLQAANTVDGPYVDVAAESPLTLPASEMMQFARARQP